MAFVLLVAGIALLTTAALQYYGYHHIQPSAVSPCMAWPVRRGACARHIMQDSYERHRFGRRLASLCLAS